MMKIRTYFYLLIFLSFNGFNSYSQSNLATVGKEFWIGFMNNYEIDPVDQLKVFITSPFNTTGVLSIPTTGYSQSFTVTAYQTTELIIPNNIAEHYTSNVIENKGILVQTVEDVSVFCLNSQTATTDGAKILPIHSLGTNYRVMAAVGLSTQSSEFLIVATEDNTQVEIVPAVNTIGGFNANIPYTVNLDRGESYQVQAVGAADLTGTTVTATASSGSCRPFAVFSGSRCTNIPTGCTACDHVCDQNIPIEAWRNEYLVAPFLGPSQYYVRVLANENNSIISRNGIVVANLNAGQYFSQVNTAATPLFISSNNNVSVAQFMTGSSCSNNFGDPAMLILNSSDQFIDNVTFTTIQSTLITIHRLNIICQTPYTNAVSLDGTVLNSAIFTPFPGNPVFSYAQVTLTPGSHTLNAPNGVQGYVYGFGNSTYETYAYSLGSSVSEIELEIDTVLCSNDSITIGNNENLFDTWWSSMANPTDTILSGSNYYSLVPSSPEIYILHGNQFLSGCPVEFLFNVESGDPAFVDVTASSDTVCLFQPVQLNANVNPPGSYNYLWTPSVGLSDPTIPNPIATIPYSVEYTLQVTSVGGCSNTTDSITITVQSGSITKFEIEFDDNYLCLGDSSQLQTNIEAIAYSEQFNSGIFGPMIGVNQGMNFSNTCVPTVGNALAFNGAGTRSVATVPLNLTAGGSLKFSLIASDLSSNCDATEFGDNIVLEYSINGGAAWTAVQTYYEWLYYNWTEINIPIPILAQTPTTIFRWRQVLHDGANFDVWLIDNVFVSTVQTSGFTVNWTPLTDIQTANQGLNATVFPTTTTTYIASLYDGVSGCLYADSVTINVGQNFTLNTTNDVYLCTYQQFQLNSQPSIPGNYTYAWTPPINLSNPTVSNPLTLTSQTITYNVSVESEFGCTREDSVTITLGELFNFNVIPNSSTLCLGDSLQSSLDFTPVTCFLASNNCTSTQTVSLGTGAVASNTISITPFPNYLSSKRQFIVTQAELAALGINSASKIQSLAFNVGAVGGNGTYQNFTIKMACTNLSSLSPQFVPNLLLVKNPSTITLTTGWNTFTFDQAYIWDGVSNIVIEICYSNSTLLTGATVFYTGATAMSLYSTGTSVCDAVSGLVSSNRPNMQFGYCAVDTTSSLIYSWTPNYNISATNIAEPVFSPAVSTTYYLTATDTVSGCVYNESLVINVAPAFDLTTSPDVSICDVGGVLISAYENSVSPVSFTWTPTQSLSDSTIQNPQASPITNTTYVVTAISQEGCSRTDSVNVSINALNSFSVSPNISTLCFGDSIQSSLYYAPESCLLASSNCVSTQTVSVGTGSSISSSSAVTPFPAYTSSKRQYLITQAELTALGMSGLNTIQSLAFNISTVGGTGIYQDFSVKIGCSNLSALPSTYVQNLFLVKNPATITLTSGWNTFTFDQGYVWDGVSNLVVEVCYNNPTTITGASIVYSVVANGSIYTYGTGVCNNLVGTTSSNRPNMQFGYCISDTTNNLSYAWTPNYNISATNIAEPVLSPDIATTYYIVATDSVSGCVYNDSIFINVAPAFDLSTSPDVSICDVGGTLISAYENSISPVSFVWTPSQSLSDSTVQNPIATPMTSTTYMLTATSLEGCSRTDSVTVTVNALNSFMAEPDSTVLCLGDSIQSTLYFTNESCILASSNCLATQTVSIGTAAFISSSSSITPFPSYASSKRQYLITQAELVALGMNGINKIQSLAFNISAVGSTGIYQDFSVKIACTNLNALPSNYVPNLLLVRNPATITLTPGWNTFTFDQGYVWDGVSNLVVEICYNNPSAITGSSVVYSGVANASIYSYGTSVCNNLAGSTSSNRPNMQFGYCIPDTANNLSYVWTPNYNISAVDIAEPVFSPLVGTTYFVTATDTVTGCVYYDSIFIDVAPAFDLSTSPDISLCTAGGVTISAIENSVSPVSFIWTPSATLSNPNSQNPVANPTVTTVYTVIAVSQEGCSHTDSVMVTLSSLNNFVVTPDNSTICLGDSIQSSVTFEPVGCVLASNNCVSTQTIATGTGSSVSSSSAITPFPTYASSKRQYLLTQTELTALGLMGINNIQSLGFNISAVGGSGVYQNFTIKIGCTNLNTLPNQYVQNLVTVKNPGTITLTSGWNAFTFDQGYVWDGVSNLIVEICYTNPSAINGASVIYSVVASSSVYNYGSSVCNSVSGTVSSNRPNIQLGYCASDTTNNLSYSWTPNVNISADNVAEPVFSPDVNTTYYVSATDTITGCIYSDSVVIFVNASNSLTVSAGPDLEFCNTLNQQLFVTNPYVNPVYSWSPANLLNNSAIANPALLFDTTATFIVIVQDPLNCGAISSDTITITSLGNPDLSIVSDQTICLGDSVQLSAVSNANNFLWTNGSTLNDDSISQPWASPTNNTTYTVTVTDTNGCSSTDSVQVFVNFVPIINSGLDTLFICPGDSITLDAGLGFGNYLWSNNSTQQTISVNAPGIYWVETNNICNNTRDSIVIQLFNEPIVNLGNDTTICPGTTIQLDAGFTANGIYSWSTFVNTQTITVGTQNQYWVNVSNSNNCSTSDTINVSIGIPPVVNLGNDTTICQGDSILLVSAPNTSYAWSTGDTTQSIVADIAGNYSVTVTDVNGCISDDEIIVSVSVIPVFSLGNDTSVCQGEIITLTTNSNLQNLWSTGVTNNTINVVSSGTYWATLTNSSQCSFTDTIIVTFNSLPDLTLSNDQLICTGDSVMLSAISNAQDIIWSNPTSLSDATSFQPWAFPTVPTMYTVTVTDSNNCVVSDSVLVDITNLNLVDLGVDTIVLCVGESILLDAGPGLDNYLWSDNSTQQTLTVNSSATIWVQTSNFCGISTDSVEVIVNNLPYLSLPNEEYICQGDSIQLNATTNANNISWTNSSTLSESDISQPWAFPDTTTVYEITVMDNNNCSSSLSILINVIVYPEVELGEDSLLLCEGENLVLDAGENFGDYFWQDNSTSQTLLVSDEGLYWVNVTNGCGIESDSVLVELDDCECTLYIPNSFTPNSDEMNNRFLPVSNCDFAELRFMIYNRWGEMIFETYSLSNPWDGTYKGQMAQDGVYTYVIIYRFKEDVTLIKNGSVTLIR